MLQSRRHYTKCPSITDNTVTHRFRKLGYVSDSQESRFKDTQVLLPLMALIIKLNDSFSSSLLVEKRQSDSNELIVVTSSSPADLLQLQGVQTTYVYYQNNTPQYLFFKMNDTYHPRTYFIINIDLCERALTTLVLVLFGHYYSFY